jgi:hypothetical protein
VFRGATVSRYEVDSLRTIENVVRRGRVRRIGTDRITMDGGEIATDPGQVHVDCTAAGVRPTVECPVFDTRRITMQYVTIGFASWSGAVLGTVEALRDDDAEKNRLCPPVVFTGNTADMLRVAHSGMQGLMARGAEPDLAAWNEASRLNPGRGAADHLDDPRVPAAFASLGANIGAALRNLDHRVVHAAR